ncbi:Peroxisomal acyl-coenzyme A oxidase 3 [Orchesella cincta]|uniref:Peroxisomal acyl-coenzyme A oxidase 3 n=1 Tax=Orchesella cincta TaxID=48709 RepID=A0A1D2N801_ORCCI|nr:Peroxisomal acyl-coenzyme A oxidase 3 [Orchesella cincta]
MMVPLIHTFPGGNQYMLSGVVSAGKGCARKVYFNRNPLAARGSYWYVKKSGRFLMNQANKDPTLWLNAGCPYKSGELFNSGCGPFLYSPRPGQVNFAACTVDRLLEYNKRIDQNAEWKGDGGTRRCSCCLQLPNLFPVGWLEMPFKNVATGGHGYLNCAGIGKLRNDNDANCTYEGDNNVLLQQASNWLITVWSNPKRHEMKDSMPLNTLSFLANHSNGVSRQTFQSQTLQDVLNPESLLEAYKWLVQWLLQSSSEKFHSNLQSGKDSFTARNDSQVYAAQSLSIAFFEHYALDRFWFGLCSQQELPQDIRQVLTKLFLLYGYWSLEKHLAILYQGGYAKGPKAADLIRQAILELCASIKGEVLSLVDAVSPPDFVLNSALGKSDGMVYKNLFLAMSQTPSAFERSSDWKEISKRLKANL